MTPESTGPTESIKRLRRPQLLPLATSIVTAIAVLVGLFPVDSDGTAAAAPAVTPPPARIENVVLAATAPAKFGMYMPPAPEQGLAPLIEVESALNRPVEVVSFYQAWGDGDHSVFRPEWVQTAASGGRQVLLTWEPWVSGGSATQPDFSLDRILNGSYDAYIKSWARGIRAYGGLVYLRPMHEMNGNWYPWSGVVNGNTPAKYIAAWKRIHGIFKRARVSNVQWVWSPLVDDVPSTNNFEKYYPGSAYVNVLALDGYNWGTSQPGYGGWRSFDGVFSNAYSRISKLGTQPIWIAEVGSATEGGDKAAWVRDMFNRLPTAYPRVAANVWFNVLKERDWRATSSPDVALAFLPPT